MNDEIARDIAAMLQRIAQAEETRNILLEREIIDRKAARLADAKAAQDALTAYLERKNDAEQGA